MVKNSNKIHKKSTIVIWILIIPAVLFLVSCGGYRQYIFTNTIADVTFEYPASFSVTSINQGELGVLAWVILSPNSKPLPGESLVVTAKNTSETIPDYQTALELGIQGKQKSQPDNQFKLENRSKISVDRVPGEQISYRFNLFDQSENPAQPKPFEARAIEAYFQKDGVIWAIWVYVSESRYDQIQKDIVHLVNSFKFLE